MAGINRVAGLHLDIDPLVVLLGITDNLATIKHAKLFVLCGIPRQEDGLTQMETLRPSYTFGLASPNKRGTTAV